jgi:two-component system phosphate regulon sensor histidine kinase PhoR
VPYGAGLRLLLAQDVTQIKMMERMRKDFVANVSHELRTPLTVLKGYLETLQDIDDGYSPVLTTSLLQMHGQTERMQYLVDDLLLLTRLETQQKNPTCVNVPELLSQICREGDTLSARPIELILETDTHIMGDEQELRSAFTNLLGNALKYSPDDSVVKVRWYRDKEGVNLTVEDQGEGIAKADISRITERFYRVEVKRREKVNGTGLGLAIVKHVLMRHHGRLIITSQLGVGSCFTCQFALKRVCR